MQHSSLGQMVLQWTYGLLPIIVGLDKLFFSKIATWESYMAPSLLAFVPFDLRTFFILIGIAEIIVGLLILTKWTRIGAYLAALWLLGISFNLILLGAYDIALRDIALAGGALGLGLLSEKRDV